jgi:hypothetical protein
MEVGTSLIYVVLAVLGEPEDICSGQLQTSCRRSRASADSPVGSNGPIRSPWSDSVRQAASCSSNQRCHSSEMSSPQAFPNLAS